MPIILNTNANTAPAANVVETSPKDFNQFMTGNGKKQGVFQASVLLNGSLGFIPKSIYNEMVSYYSVEDGKVYRGSKYNYGTQKNDEYSVLQQRISIFQPSNMPVDAYSSQSKIPLQKLYDLMDEHLLTYRDHNGNDVEVKCRIGISKIYVYKAINNYTFADLYCIIISPDGTFNHCINMENIRNSPVVDLLSKLFERIDNVITTVQSNNKNISVTVNNLANIQKAYEIKTLYSLLCEESRLIKEPSLDTILDTLALHFDTFHHALNSLNNIDLTFIKYQSDVIKHIGKFTQREQNILYNDNMSAGLANTLASLGQNTNATIPELVGKTYTTQQIRLTPEQIAAVTSDKKITIVAAGAGTGKSSSIKHRLEFMRENGIDMSKVYVLSFTKAAAEHIKKIDKNCQSSTIADFTHRFVETYFGKHVGIVNNIDLIQKLTYLTDNLENSKAVNQSIIDDVRNFIVALNSENEGNARMLTLLDPNNCANANNILAILNKLNITSLTLDPVIFATQLQAFKPNIEHIIIDEAQDSNELEFLNILKLAIQNNISLYVVGDCAQTLYEFRDANPKILNNLTKLFATFDLSVNHRSTQIILDVANLISNTMSTHKTKLIANNIMNITQQAIDDAITIEMFNKSTDPDTQKTLKDYVDKHIGKNETIAVIARTSKDVNNAFNFLSTTYPNNTVINITSQRVYESVVLKKLADELDKIVPQQTNATNLITILRNTALNIFNQNAIAKNQAPSAVCRVFEGWAQETDLNYWAAQLNANRATEMPKFKDCMLNYEIKYNTTKQRIIDAKNAKLKASKADIIVSTVHGVKGLEYDHVACFIDDGITSSTDTNKRISYVALTRAKLTECIFCVHEKFVKEVKAYRDSMPDENAGNDDGSTDDTDGNGSGDSGVVNTTEEVTEETAIPFV